MTGLTTFDATREVLSDILKSVEDGRTQLPDFQRGWVWDDYNVRSLLASVSLSYPIGAVMMLQAGGDSVRFKTRLLEGADASTATRPIERLVLDGQQRITSLFQALYSKRPVATRDARDRPIQRWYYIDIGKALVEDGDREEAIISVPESKLVTDFRGKVIFDLRTTAGECAAGMLPASILFDVVALMNWQQTYLTADPTKMSKRLEAWAALSVAVVTRFQQYSLPVISLRKETPKDAVCQVFEKVNTRGVSLTVFELLTATYAVDDFALRDDWAARQAIIHDHPALSGVENTDFLQSVSLLATYNRRERALSEGTGIDAAPGVSCKRREVLRLSREEYERFAPKVVEGYQRVARLLFGQKIFAARDLPYHSQVVPLAAVFAHLGPRKSEQAATQAKILRWFWCGVFGELYGGGTESRFARDMIELVRWINNGDEPSTVTEANFVPDRLQRLRTRNSAAYKGLYALLMRDGLHDLRTGEPIEAQQYFDDSVDIHHVFPKHWCKENEIDNRRRDCIINRTPLSARTNRMIGGSAPSEYLKKVARDAGVKDATINGYLESHLIEPKHLRRDDFEKFFAARQVSLLERIELAMGKALAGSSTAGEDEDEDE
jgi:hypothetical protein